MLALDVTPPGRHRVDVEWCALRAGVKPALRTSIEPAFAGQAAARMREAGYSVIQAGRDLRWPGGQSQAILYVARSESLAEALRDAEAPVLPGGPPRPPSPDVLAAHERVGTLLGFPPCCIDSYLARLRRGVGTRAGGGTAHEDFVAAEDAAGRSRLLHGRLNEILRTRGPCLLSFYPCRFDCSRALAYADAALAAVRSEDPEAAARLCAALAVPLWIHVEGPRGLEEEPPPAGDLLRLDFRRF